MFNIPRAPAVPAGLYNNPLCGPQMFPHFQSGPLNYLPLPWPGPPAVSDCCLYILQAGCIRKKNCYLILVKMCLFNTSGWQTDVLHAPATSTSTSRALPGGADGSTASAVQRGSYRAGLVVLHVVLCMLLTCCCLLAWGLEINVGYFHFCLLCLD